MLKVKLYPMRNELRQIIREKVLSHKRGSQDSNSDKPLKHEIFERDDTW